MITKQDIQYTYPQLQFFRNGTFQFTIDNEIELHNVRLLAAQGGWWNEVEFSWKEEIIHGLGLIPPINVVTCWL